MHLCSSLSILWHCLSLGLEWKLTFSSAVATAEFSKFAGILSAALSQHHLSGFEIIQLEFHLPHPGIEPRSPALQADALTSKPPGKTSIPKKGNAKECSDYHTIVFISHASKVMLKILQARLQQYANCELADIQAGFRKGNQRSNCQHLLDHWKSKRVPEKHLFLLFWLYQSLWLDHSKLWKSLKVMGIADHLTCLWEICVQVRKQQLELDMEQQTGSK